jgi:hypothetical protein
VERESETGLPFPQGNSTNKAAKTFDMADGESKDEVTNKIGTEQENSVRKDNLDQDITSQMKVVKTSRTTARRELTLAIKSLGRHLKGDVPSVRGSHKADLGILQETDRIKLTISSIFFTRTVQSTADALTTSKRHTIIWMPPR